jgi:DNA-binding FadR family transcriptional regulator
MQNDARDSRKLYRKIALTMAASITDGRYCLGDKLPSEQI